MQYEHGQSRIGGNIWEMPLQYIENSPLFNMDKVTTPILIMHNDADGHVPWYQGIEYLSPSSASKTDLVAQLHR